MRTKQARSSPHLRETSRIRNKPKETTSRKERKGELSQRTRRVPQENNV